MLIVWPGSPLNEPEDDDDEDDGDDDEDDGDDDESEEDDEEDGHSEGDDDDYSEKLIMTIRVLGLLIVTANRPTQLPRTTNAHRPITSLCCCRV